MKPDKRKASTISARIRFDKNVIIEISPFMKSLLSFGVFGRLATGLGFALILRCSPELLFTDLFFVLDDCFLSFRNLAFPFLDFLLSVSLLFPISSSLASDFPASLNSPLFSCCSLRLSISRSLSVWASVFCGAVPLSHDEAPKAPSDSDAMITNKNLLARLSIIFCLRLMESSRFLPSKRSTENLSRQDAMKPIYLFLRTLAPLRLCGSHCVTRPGQPKPDRPSDAPPFR